MISLGCQQPVHMCTCRDCDDERRANIRETASRLQEKYAAFVEIEDEDSGRVYCGPTSRPRSK